MVRYADSVSVVSFYEWAKDAASGLSDEKIAACIGVTGKTVGRWKDHDPNPRDVLRFAKEFERTIPEALRNAYGLTAKDLEQTDLDPRTLSDTDLLVQLVTRLHVDPEQMYRALGGGQAVFQSDRKSREAHARPRR